MQGIKNIVFDWGGVMINLDKVRCVNAFDKIGAHHISSYVDECRQEDLFHDLEMGSITVPQFCDEVRRQCPECVATDEEICWAWGELLTGIPEYRVEKLRTLKSKYRLFLLSNTNVIHWEPFAHRLEGCFEKMFLSYEMHLVKPDAEIFREVLRQTGIRAEETLFIDDSANNCAGAASLGIHTHQVKVSDDWLELPF
ncbi:MAG: HAD family phosphatase [Prevotella sp.]|nr:HAD family phosphatase [Prevotella sp.]